MKERNAGQIGEVARGQFGCRRSTEAAGSIDFCRSGEESEVWGRTKKIVSVSELYSPKSAMVV